MNVIVTGAAGYIGGHVALQLQDAGHTVVGIDYRPLQPHQKGLLDSFVLADFDSDTAYKKLLDVRPEAIVHCAGTSLVGPSIKHPSTYYINNVAKTLHLINFISQAMPKTRLIFSSSAATYGEPIMTPCQEVDPCLPVSPYGESKLMIDMMLESYHRAYRLDYVSFRYFNACGADPQGRHGQEPGATHLIARFLEATRDDGNFNVYGTDYPTPDGTCVRDYVHVDDIARAHVLALDRAIPCGVYNLGSNTGTSVLQVMERARTIIGKMPYIGSEDRREGDPPVLTASAAKFAAVAGPWQQHTLDDMIQHAWKWYTK